MKEKILFFANIRDSWKKRVRRHLINVAGKEDWCTFAKALCGSWESCHGFPYECKGCFDIYFDSKEILQHVLEK